MLGRATQGRAFDQWAIGQVRSLRTSHVLSTSFSHTTLLHNISDGLHVSVRGIFTSYRYIPLYQHSLSGSPTTIAKRFKVTRIAVNRAGLVNYSQPSDADLEPTKDEHGRVIPLEKPTPLATDLMTLIKLKGPITLHDYIAQSLNHGMFGYYQRRQEIQPQIGSRGDFVTAPEISQLFGEMVAVWCLAVWESMGKPEQVRLIEMGPGKGTLMRDILRVANKFPAFRKALSVHFVELSVSLRRAQRDALKGELIGSINNGGNAEDCAGSSQQDGIEGLNAENDKVKDGEQHIGLFDIPLTWHSFLHQVPVFSSDSGSDRPDIMSSSRVGGVSGGSASAMSGKHGLNLAAANEKANKKPADSLIGVAKNERKYGILRGTTKDFGTERAKVAGQECQKGKNGLDSDRTDPSTDPVPVPVPVLIIGQEFLDAFPVHQFVYTGQHWREKLVDIDPRARQRYDASPDADVDVDVNNIDTNDISSSGSSSNSSGGSSRGANTVERDMDTKTDALDGDMKERGEGESYGGGGEGSVCTPLKETPLFKLVLAPASTPALSLLLGGQHSATDASILSTSFRGLKERGGRLAATTAVTAVREEKGKKIDSSMEKEEEEEVTGSGSKSVSGLKKGDGLEISPLALATCEDVAGRVALCGGAALLVDYGEDFTQEDSLRGFYNHTQTSVLSKPGEVDLTADVDFATCARVARARGAYVAPVSTQGDFLMRMGIVQRAQRLIEADEVTEEQASQLVTALKRLVTDSWEEPVDSLGNAEEQQAAAGTGAAGGVITHAGMGVRYKVLGISHPSLVSPTLRSDQVNPPAQEEQSQGLAQWQQGQQGQGMEKGEMQSPRQTETLRSLPGFLS